MPSGMNAEEKIREFEKQLGITPSNGIPINYNRQGETIGGLLFLVLMVAAFGLASLAFRRPQGPSGAGGAGGMMNPFGQLSKAKFTLVSPLIRQGKGTKFSDVAGMQEAKVEVIEFVDFLKNPDKYKELGAKPPKVSIKGISFSDNAVECQTPRAMVI